ncbi:hypothetical protein [Staphylococcus massiliensis]|uniref:hypothetical protein n=1 Tax=Staphylococcus massiliensis TaxID=555791 RepID=UPI001EDFDDAC|nr:hypothetical protein [Staphylococcus massiliensis]MCG3399630.1 hypothetical protein [Staphylococcus massiliensis]MCG3400735.1 hypothetical protein [Staphylococcus massiliensis]MCG3412100.1 hypothetical protein [Staphylococcus massiliensis]
MKLKALSSLIFSVIIAGMFFLMSNSSAQAAELPYADSINELKSSVSDHQVVQHIDSAVNSNQQRVELVRLTNSVDQGQPTDNYSVKQSTNFQTQISEQQNASGQVSQQATHNKANPTNLNETGQANPSQQQAVNHYGDNETAVTSVNVTNNNYYY